MFANIAMIQAGLENGTAKLAIAEVNIYPTREVGLPLPAFQAAIADRLRIIMEIFLFKAPPDLSRLELNVSKRFVIDQAIKGEHRKKVFNHSTLLNIPDG